MTLQELIRSVDGWAAMTAEEVFDSLTELRTEPNPTPYTFASMSQAIGGENGLYISGLVATTMLRVVEKDLVLPDEMQAIRGLIQGSFIAMSATAEGLSLHTQERQELIGLLGNLGQWPSQVTAAVSSLGVRQFTLASDAGLSIVLGDVQVAIAAIVLDGEKTIRKIQAAQRYNTYIDAIDAHDGVGDWPVL